MPQTPEILGRILLAIVAGGIIGAEREYRDKAAGFRTIIFISLGACLFTLLSLRLGGLDDPVRIAANVVTGVGFLGAGAILRNSQGRATGITTAATIWLAAALGMGFGGGDYVVAGAGTAAIAAVLWLFPPIEDLIDRRQHTRDYHIQCSADPAGWAGVEDAFTQAGLRKRVVSRVKSGDVVTWKIVAWGPPTRHEQLVRALSANAEVKELHD